MHRQFFSVGVEFPWGEHWMSVASRVAWVDRWPIPANQLKMADLLGILADGEGFEPSRRLRVCRFSRPVPSTTRPPIHNGFIRDN
jgi:hypothetical protein